jgi:hypothetical protein
MSSMDNDFLVNSIEWMYDKHSEPHNVTKYGYVLFTPGFIPKGGKRIRVMFTEAKWYTGKVIGAEVVVSAVAPQG